MDVLGEKLVELAIKMALTERVLVTCAADGAVLLQHPAEPPAEDAHAGRLAAGALRRAQQQRIAAQKSPNGTSYEARHAAPLRRAKAGRIKRGAMFAEIQQARHLRLRPTVN